MSVQLCGMSSSLFCYVYLAMETFFWKYYLFSIKKFECLQK